MAVSKEVLEIITELNRAAQENLGTTIRAIASEMRKPTELEQQQIDADETAKKERQAERLENSANVRKQIEDRRLAQMTCSHAHADGHTHLHHVIDNGTYASGPGYLHCQWCNARIRPEDPEVRKLDPQAIFDTGLFNRLFQTLPNQALYG